MRKRQAPGYDCHVEICHRTSPRRLQQYLDASRPAGAVLVQASEVAAARRNLLEGLAVLPSARGIARLSVLDDACAIAALERSGVRGARLDIEEGGPWTLLARVERLHERLPRPWHIELALCADPVTRLAPLLARMDRVFTLRCRHDHAVPPDRRHKLQWWLEMGNLYLKLVPHCADEPSPGWWEAICREVPDRVVTGSGWPAAELRAPVPEPLSEYADSNAERLYQFAPRLRREHR